MSKRNKKPWPTQKAMEQVYEKHLWGGSEFEFYSGEGSHDIDLVKPYVSVIRTFLSSFQKPLTVSDLGCGDFNIGSQLVDLTSQYEAVDIVPKLIAFNKEKNQQDYLNFHCLDIATDDLPNGDCALIRQVLQHLSNAEIQQILPKFNKFKYVILTEHLPAYPFEPNKDIISGQGIRLKKKSGVDLLASPFNFKVKSSKVLLELPLKNNKGVIKTTLYLKF